MITNHTLQRIIIQNQVTTNIIGPDLTIPESLNTVIGYLRTYRNYKDDYIKDSEYMKLLRIARSDAKLKDILSTLPRTNPTTLELNNIITKSEYVYESYSHAYNFSSTYKAPGYSRLELSIKPTSSGIILFIDDFFPGYIMTGQAGLGKPIFEQILKYAKFHNCNKIKVRPIHHSITFWHRIGFRTVKIEKDVFEYNL